MTCSATCSGFRSLRAECLANPCLATNLCRTVDPTIPRGMSCADWCCTSHAIAVFVLVLLFCGSAFMFVVSYYFRRLYVHNLRNELTAKVKAKSGAGSGH
jgi:hypothetical protein